MNIKVNGAPEEIAEATTLTALLAAKKLDTAQLIIELNGAILDEPANRTLKAGDEVNLFSVVAGG